MKTATLLAIGVVTAKVVVAQEITVERYVFGATGSSRTSNEIHVSATAGQTAVGTRTAENVVFTQGFQQQWLEAPVSRIQVPGRNISLFPNPTDGVFEISGLDDVHVEVFDLIGKRIELRQDGRRFEFPENAAEGVYPVRMTLLRPDGTVDYVNFKIQLYR